MDQYVALLAQSGFDGLFDAVSDNWMWTVGGAIAIVAIISGSIKCLAQSCARERTRREIAAYIAEGSMSPEQGERLMNAGHSEE